MNKLKTMTYLQTDYLTNKMIRYTLKLRKFEFNGQEQFEIVDFAGKERLAIKLPEHIAGVRITSIGKEAFKNKNLAGIKMNQSISSIGDRAFVGNLFYDFEFSEEYERNTEALFWSKQALFKEFDRLFKEQEETPKNDVKTNIVYLFAEGGS